MANEPVVEKPEPTLQRLFVNKREVIRFIESCDLPLRDRALLLSMQNLSLEHVRLLENYLQMRVLQLLDQLVAETRKRR